MRVAGFALISSLALFAGTPALASDGDVLKQFGMLGTVAINCGAPSGPDNAYMIYAVDAAGQATRTVQTGGAIDATLKMRNVHLVRDDLLEYEETGRQSELLVNVIKIDRKFRGWRTERTSGPEKGTLLVEKGVAKYTGKPTVAFTFCHAN